MSYTLRAVLVGIDEYTHARHQNISKLRCARNDALAIASMLQTSTVLRLDADNFHQLINEQASDRAVRRAMNDCFSRRSLDQKTISLFYFAGHGIVKNELVYLCSHNVDFYYPEERGIRLNDVYDWLKTCNTECAIAIIDACFSGGLTTDNPKHISAAERARHAIEEMKTPDGKTIAIMAACGSDQRAREDPGQKHGIFTQRILLGLRDGQARDSDGTVTLVGLINYLDKSFTHEQHQQPRFSFTSSGPIVLGKTAPGIRPVIAPSPLPEIRPAQRPPVTAAKPQSELLVQGNTRSATPSYIVPGIKIPGPSQNSSEFKVPEPKQPFLNSPTSHVNLKRILLILGFLFLCILIYLFIRR